MSHVGAPPPAPRTRSGCLTALKVLLVVGLLGALAITAIVWWGFSAFEGKVQEALQDDPVVTRHLGRVQEVDFDFSDSTQTGVPNMMAFDVRGERGEGQVVALIATEADGRVLGPGTLRLPDGREFDIGPGAQAPVPAEPTPSEPAPVEPAPGEPAPPQP